MPYELGRELISGTPGTAGALTVTAASAPAYPRLHQVAEIGSPVQYTIEDGSGLVLCTGIGKSTAAGAFTRVIETSHWGGTTYNPRPTTLYSLPSGCVIYCSLPAACAAPVMARACTVDANQWVPPHPLLPLSMSSPFTVTANRDYFWRFPISYPGKIDAIAIHANAAATYDIGLYEVDPSNGNPGVLLLGWQGATVAIGMNTLLLSAATLGAFPKSAQRLPLGDFWWMLNMSAGSSNRHFPNIGSGGSATSDLSAPQNLVYVASRTAGTSFASSPTLTGRFPTAVTHVPMIVFRGA